MQQEQPATSDSTTTLSDLKTLIQDFVDQRDWNQFHSPKNLSMSMAIEAAELMEHFQWISMDESRETPDNPEKLHDVGEEIADVICYAIALCNQLELDIATVVTNKMEKNVAKYPAEEFTGRYGHKHRT
ncbi:MAG TPA: NTP pyrophosphohydrolase [Planctomycetaceae bacterium]|jgi:NTP pyrophosphatase (non-canonical NTP hydrolase)|nr:NTP pyrophosphohydrolase [Planctomycetaceae bacterium]HCP84698.1 NTP pyrophosphohydrolase [Planctomycetaceae bacterium]|tara:strand:- start:5836 stop:6222 length:387 start_codon:yes stop_codon:yes gene_type:complete